MQSDSKSTQDNSLKENWNNNFLHKITGSGWKRGRRNTWERADFTRTGLAKSSWQREILFFIQIHFLVEKIGKWSSFSSLASIKGGRFEKRWVGLGHLVGGVSWLLDRTSERSRPAATPAPRWRPGPAPRAASLPVPTAVSCSMQSIIQWQLITITAQCRVHPQLLNYGKLKFRTLIYLICRSVSA